MKKTLLITAILLAFGNVQAKTMVEEGVSVISGNESTVRNFVHQLGKVTIDGKVVNFTQDNLNEGYVIGSDTARNVEIYQRGYARLNQNVGGTIKPVKYTNKALMASGDKVTNTILGKNIIVEANDGRGFQASSGATLNIGGSTTELISIHAQDIGIFSHAPKSVVNVKTQKLVVNADDESSYGLHVQSNTQESTVPDGSALLKVEADTIEINSKGLGLSAFSNGQMDISGDIVVNAPNALDVRGNSDTKVNADGKHSTVFNGDIVFETPNTPKDSQSSGNLINAYVNVKFSGENSQFNGRAYQSMGSGDSYKESVALNNLDEYYGDVTGFTLTFQNGAQWNMTGSSFVNTITVENGAAVNVSEKATRFNVDTMTLKNASLNMQGGTDQHVSINTLNSQNGTVTMHATTKDGKTVRAGQLKVVNKMDANSAVNVQYSGITADDIADADAAMMSLQDSVSVTGGQTTKTIVEGAVNGAITQGADGKVTIQENKKLDAYDSLTVLSAMTWRHEMNSLSKRMGELRDAPAGVGAWVRLYGSDMEYGKQNLESKNVTVQVGSDISVGDWKLGAAFNYTDGRTRYDAGDADSQNYGVALYGTWFIPCGAYVDLMGKYERLDNDFAFNGMNGSYSNNAFSVSAETGYRFAFMQDRFFVEPQVGLSYGRIMGDDFTASNGARIDQDDYDSFLGRVGVRTGFTFPENKGSLYFRVSGVHDFDGEMKAVATSGIACQEIRNDLGDTWLEMGIGANFNLTDRTYTYVDMERTTGGTVTENYRWNVGVRHAF